MAKEINKKVNGYGQIKLVSIKSSIPCYTKESVDKKIEKMQDRIDFLVGQNFRLKNHSKNLELWKSVVGKYSMYDIKKMIEKHEKNKTIPKP